MNKTIIQFIKEQTCAGICCIDKAGKPYCFSCYYAFNAEKGLLYFKSSRESHHAALLLNNPAVAGTILPDKLSALVVKGLQFEGILLDGADPMAKNASVFYHKTKPMALAVPGEVWTVQIDSIKMTDSTLGFGKKIKWEREHREEVSGYDILSNLN